MSTRAELGEFLRSRRARLRPEDVVIRPCGGQRRVPGLRREELAQLAGVSVDYYIRLEQGRVGNPSDVVLDAIARALRLDTVEHTHLRNLVRPPVPADRADSPPPGEDGPAVRPALQQLLDALEGVPAYVAGPRTDILAWNRMAADLMIDFGSVDVNERTWAHLVFTNPAIGGLFVDWHGKARDTVAYLRLSAGRYPDDPALAALIEELHEVNADFRHLWQDQNVREKTYGTKEFRHPVVGELTLDYETLRLPDAPDQVLVTYTAPAGSPDRRALALLTGWAQVPGTLTAPLERPQPTDAIGAA
jgi:transcriptional regulator with XRE-family HTH domain